MSEFYSIARTAASPVNNSVVAGGGRQQSHSLISNSNVPTVNASYVPERSRPPPSKATCTRALEAIGEKPTGKCNTVTCLAKHLYDHIQTQFAENEAQYHVLVATRFDRYAPDYKHLERLTFYVATKEGGGEEVLGYLCSRMAEGNSVVIAKCMIVAHRLITATDTRFIQPLLGIQENKDKNFHALSEMCRKRGVGGPNCDSGIALPILEIYGAYLQALSLHLRAITTQLGTNIFREKAHNNNFLSRMEMDASLASLVKQSTEVLMVIATLPVNAALCELEVMRVILSALLVDAMCLYGFDSKALDAGFIQRKGTRDKAGLQRWMRSFQSYETAGIALNTFFDTISDLHIRLPVSVPRLKVPAEGTAAQIRAAIGGILSDPNAVDPCVIDYTLAEALKAASLEAPEPSCERKLREFSTVTGSLPKSDSGALTSSNVSSNGSSSNTGVTGFRIPKDASDYTIQRMASTIMSEANTLDSWNDTLPVDMTATDPLATAEKKPSWEPSFEEQAPSRFVLFTDEVLGKGSYGVVYKAWDEAEGRHVACKQITRRTSARHATATDTTGTIDGVESSLKSEFRVLTDLHHENVVTVLAFESLPTVSRIFMEWVPGGSVQDILKRTGRGLSLSVIRRYLTCALKGLAYVHERSLVHRDIKPGNMLVDSTGMVKLTDFGTSTLLQQVAAEDGSDSESSRNSGAATKSIVGTIPYLAPENFQGYYGTPSDIWALGASAVHMYSGKVPWSERGYADTLQLVFCIGSAKPPEHHPSYVGGVVGLASPSGDFQDFLDACFIYDKDKRPSAAELLLHPFITNEVKTPITSS